MVDDEARAALAPELEPTPTTASTSIAGGSSVPTTSTTPAAAPSAGAADLAASIEDPAGDASAIDGAPAWSDVLGARITLSRAGYELRVRLAGGAAPDRATDDNTMNVASFFDIDGDGTIDHEIWANLGEGGWGASYYDNGTGEALHGERSFVTVEPEGDEVVVRFARLHLEDAEAFRWSITTEWGPFVGIGTASMARDQAPDAGGAASFPGA